MAQKETSSKSRRWLGLSGAAVLVANLVPVSYTHLTLVLCLGILCSVLCPDFLCHAESRPRLGPTYIK